MATGDKLFLADKPTLDEVKLGVENIGTHVDVTRQQVIESRAVIDSTKSVLDTVKSDLSQARNDISDVKSIASAIQTNSAPNYILATDIAKSMYKGVSNATGTGYRDILNVQDSGVLHFAYSTVPYNNANPNTVYLSIIIDGITVYQSSHTASSNLIYRIGHIATTSVLGVQDNLVRVTNGEQLNLNVITTPVNSAIGNPLTFSDKPIRFNTSLIIRGYTTTSSAVVHYHYTLD